tara:strand:+ start:167 stop:412 length:246 start_codon:yes stop_codon:yes gene_type:complete
MGWVKETHAVELIKSNALDGHWIAKVETKANAKHAHRRSALDDAWQQTRQLSAIQHKIVRPFDPDRKAMALQSFRERHRHC